MDYSKFSVEQFVSDDYFRQWVNGKLPAEDRFWETWLELNPDSYYAIDCARFVVKSLEMKHEESGQQRTMEGVHRIMNVIEKERESEPSNPLFFWWKVAAVFVLTAGVAWYFFRPEGTSQSLYETMAVTQGNQNIEKINNGDQPLRISLSDGSSITLQPGSRLSYPATFALDKREVLLSGEAFFDVAREPRRPFSVYANELVTKVLGTSFSIKAYDNARDVIVKVMTGKVSVLKSKPYSSHRFPGQSEGLILTPNQMAVYARSNEILTRSLVENPTIVKLSNRKPSDFNFQDIPVAEVFRVLEEGYGIPILYNAELLAGCTVTAPLGSETLYEKLAMICKVIRANYEVVDAQIVITSSGCK